MNGALLELLPADPGSAGVGFWKPELCCICTNMLLPWVPVELTSFSGILPLLLAWEPCGIMALFSLADAPHPAGIWRCT